MRVLVTGASGHIGRAVVDALRGDGYSVTALSADDAEFPEDVRVRKGNAGDPEVVAEALGECGAVVHLAAISNPALGTPREVFTNNVVATFTVLNQAAEAGIDRVVLASSINATGISFNPNGPMPAYFPLDEDLPTDLGDAYSLSKRTDENTAHMAAQMWGLTVISLRFPVVMSIPQLRGVAKHKAANIAAGVREGWSYLTLGDAGRAVTAALNAPLTGDHVVFVAAADTLIRHPTAALLAEHAPGVPIRKPIEGYGSAIDTTRARRLLGFTPTESIY